jgi:hypothetical protein
MSETLCVEVENDCIRLGVKEVGIEGWVKLKEIREEEGKD